MEKWVNILIYGSDLCQAKQILKSSDNLNVGFFVELFVEYYFSLNNVLVWDGTRLRRGNPVVLHSYSSQSADKPLAKET